MASSLSSGRVSTCVGAMTTRTRQDDPRSDPSAALSTAANRLPGASALAKPRTHPRTAYGGGRALPDLWWAVTRKSGIAGMDGGRVPAALAETRGVEFG
jgi:hypothetical protein